MNNFNWATRSVRDAPKGKHVGAFFDLDGTLVEGFTALRFLLDELWRGEMSVASVASILKDAATYRNDPHSGLDMIERGVEQLRGRSLESMDERADRVFRQQIARSIRPQARALVREHFQAGHTVVIATAATQFQAGPVAKDLGIAHLLSTEVVIEDGVLTGAVKGPPRWGAEKARAVTDFADQHGIDLQKSFAYGNGTEDWDFLQAVGHPVAVSPDPGLLKRIDDRFVVLDMESPPQPSLRSLVGTLSAFGTFNAGIVLTLLASTVIDRQTALSFGIGQTADLTLALAGIRVRAQGQEHIEAARPAVFIFNHQSNLDPGIVASLLRRDITGVGKAELKTDPRGIALRLMNIALIDRSNSAEARASVAALIDRIHEGESVLIAPEGTRMPTPKLGRFKMGAFHLAMDARVPVVPIVIRNSGEHWPKGTQLIRPGVVDVAVLPPISTAEWTPENLKDNVSAIRSTMETTLEHWPT